MVQQQIRPDSKGRVTLGKLAEGISSFAVLSQPDGNLLLIPMVEIPAREKWLFDNKDALASVKRGLADSAQGNTLLTNSSSKVKARRHTTAELLKGAKQDNIQALIAQTKWARKGGGIGRELT